MRFLHWVRSLWANLVHRDRVEESLDDELRAYLDLLTADYQRRGLSPDEARRAALVNIGGLAQVKERTRDVWAGDALAIGRRELRYTWRSLRRSPGFLVTVVLIISLGIGANATIFGVIDDLLFRPPANVKNPDRVVLLTMAVPKERVGQQTLNFPVYRTLHAEWRSAEVVAIAASGPVQVPLGRGTDAEDVLAFPVSASYFRMLGVEPERGRFFVDDEDAEPNGVPVAVISDGFWTRHFARDPEVLGKALEIGNRRFTVMGVSPRGFTGTELGRVDLWLPITAAMRPFVSDNPNWQREAFGTYAHLFARVRPEVPFADAAREAGRILANAYPDAWWDRNDRSPRLIPLRVARSMNLGTENSLLTLLAAMALVVLLIVIANVASLLLARALRRRREIAVRLALGASRVQLVRLLLTECLVLSVMSGVVAVFVTYWCSEAIRGLLFADVAWSSSIVNGRLLAFSALAVMVVALFAGLLPALESTRAELTTALKAGAREGGGQRTGSRRMLIIAQVALTTMLLAGAGLFLRSLRNVYALRLGVDTDRVLYGQMYLSALDKQPDEVELLTRAQLARVRALPGISHAAVALTVPFGPSWGADVRLPGGDSLPRGDGPYLNLVGGGYFATLGARVLEGREFTDVDDRPASPRVVVVSAAMARRVSRGASALGRCIIVGEQAAPCASIVGVVEDIRRQQMFDEEPPMVYLPLAQAQVVPRTWRSELYLIARPVGDAARMIEPMRRAMQSAAAGMPRATVQRIADRPEVLMQIRQWRLGTMLFGSFGVLALVLAAVGLFGLISYSVASRVHEIGVRMALGARGTSVAGMIMTQALVVDAMGVGAGIIAAIIAQRLIVSLLYGVSPYDPIVFAAVTGTMLLVGMVASIVPVAQALSIDALEALRAD
ncbi:MAG TPA: ADOP family duplicated permease [Gemmatimonadaceae bacterium]|jgi:predicted permease